MTENAYMTAWLLYLVGAVLMLLLCWWLGRRAPALLMTPLVVVLAVLLIMPWSVAPESASLAPAWVVALFDGLIREGESFRRAGIPLLSASLLALLPGVALGWYRHSRR